VGVNKFTALGIACIFGGAAALGYAVATGSGSVGFFLIVPYVSGTGPLSALGGLLLFAGIVLTFWGMAGKAVEDAGVVYEEYEPEEQKPRVGGVVLIGPVPIIFGSDKRMALLSAVAAAIMVLALVVIILVTR